MRRVFAFLILPGLVGVGATAVSAERLSTVAAQGLGPQERLNALFHDLKRERNEQAAARIADAIRAEWFASGSATVDLLMLRAGEAMAVKRFDAALDLLDEVTALAPDYAEGWNRRATLHFMMGNYSRSLTDIERTLRLEPRHFGALSGMATIFKMSEQKEAALETFGRVLSIYPMLRSAQQEMGELADELAGEGI